jgi:WD40 repeat protein
MGGTSLQMWKLSRKIGLMMGDSPNQKANYYGGANNGDIHWECVWKCATATEVHFLSFSTDSCLFATAGKFDRLVKIWYPMSSKF